MCERHLLHVKLRLFLETFFKGAQIAHTFLAKTYTVQFVTINKLALEFFLRNYNIPRTYGRSRSQSIQINTLLLNIHFNASCSCAATLMQKLLMRLHLCCSFRKFISSSLLVCFVSDKIICFGFFI